MTESESVPLRWDKPGPGTWHHDSAHSSGPTSTVVQGILPLAFEKGFKDFCASYGLPISHIELRYVNGHPYDAVRIAGVRPSDRPPPPAWILRVITRLHPEMRRRERRAAEAFDRSIWRTELEHWDQNLRPARIARNRTIQSVDPPSLVDAELASHIDIAAENLAAALREHFALVGATSIPIGLHLVRSADTRAAAEQLRGAAAKSTGATLSALAKIVDALDAVGSEPSSLEEIRSASLDAADALDAYLADYGERVITSYDVSGKRLVELPDVVLRSVAARRGAGDSSLDDVRSRPDSGTNAAAHPSDEVLGDARWAAASRDDHAGTGLWAMGLLRRALLEAGRRLTRSGQLCSPDGVFDCEVEEVTGLLRGLRSPSSESIAGRTASRTRAATLVPPPLLGVEVAEPDASVFPPAMRRMSAAMSAFRDVMDGGHPVGGGVAIGTESHRGRAVVALHPEDAIERLQPGDVLVTTMTTAAFNCILPIVGALVTVHGGLMSHAGIAARELGITAVLGVADAIERIPDGAEILVDPIASAVRVLRLRDQP